MVGCLAVDREEELNLIGAGLFGASRLCLGNEGQNGPETPTAMPSILLSSRILAGSRDSQASTKCAISWQKSEAKGKVSEVPCHVPVAG